MNIWAHNFLPSEGESPLLKCVMVAKNPRLIRYSVLRMQLKRNTLLFILVFSNTMISNAAGSQPECDNTSSSAYQDTAVRHKSFSLEKIIQIVF